MVDIIVLRSLEIALDIHLVGVLEFHSGIGVETFAEVMGQVFELLGASAALEDEGLGGQALLLGVGLFVGADFFLS